MLDGRRDIDGRTHEQMDVHACQLLVPPAPNLEREQVGLRFWPASGNCDPPFGAPSTKFGEGAGRIAFFGLPVPVATVTPFLVPPAPNFGENTSWITFLAYQWQL